MGAWHSTLFLQGNLHAHTSPRLGGGGVSGGGGGSANFIFMGAGGSFLPQDPKGPKIEKIQDRPPGLKFSIEIENSKRAAHQTRNFVGMSEGQD